MSIIFTRFGITRDSALWLWAKIASLAGLVAAGVINPSQLGLSEQQTHVVMVVCGAIAYVAGQMSTSSLPGRSDRATVSESTLDKIARSVPTVLLALTVAGAAMPGCASAPPAGTYSATGQKAYTADTLLKDIEAISETAIRLNAATGKEHLSDRDTALVRDFALSAGAALQSYGTGGTTLQTARDAYGALMQAISVDAKQQPALAALLFTIGGALNQVR